MRGATDITFVTLIVLIALAALGLAALLYDRWARNRSPLTKANAPFGIPLLHSLVHDRSVTVRVGSKAFAPAAAAAELPVAQPAASVPAERISSPALITPRPTPFPRPTPPRPEPKLRQALAIAPAKTEPNDDVPDARPAAPHARPATPDARPAAADARAAAADTRLGPAPRLRRGHAATEPTVVIAAGFDIDATVVRREPEARAPAAAGPASFVLDVGNATMPALRVIAPEEPTVMAAALRTRAAFAGDSGPSLRLLEPSLLDRAPHRGPDDGTTDAVPSLRVLERAAARARLDAADDGDDAPAIEPPTYEVSSLRALERSAGIAAPSTEPLRFTTTVADGERDAEAELATEVELFSLRALEHAAAHAAPSDPTILLPRPRVYTESVMTSATRPVPRLAAQDSAAPTSPMPARATRKTAVPPPVPSRAIRPASRTAAPRTSPPRPPPRAGEPERTARTSYETPLGIAILSDLSRVTR